MQPDSFSLLLKKFHMKLSKYFLELQKLWGTWKVHLYKLLVILPLLRDICNQERQHAWNFDTGSGPIAHVFVSLGVTKHVAVLSG